MKDLKGSWDEAVTLGIALIVGGLLGIVWVAVGALEIHTGSGETTDTVHSIEYSGIIFKTWKIWLTNDHPTEKNDAIYALDGYEPSLINSLKSAKANNTKVKLKYDTLLVAPFWRYSSGTIITSAELLENK